MVEHRIEIQSQDLSVDTGLAATLLTLTDQARISYLKEIHGIPISNQKVELSNIALDIQSYSPDINGKLLVESRLIDERDNKLYLESNVSNESNPIATGETVTLLE